VLQNEEKEKKFKTGKSLTRRKRDKGLVHLSPEKPKSGYKKGRKQKDKTQEKAMLRGYREREERTIKV